MITLRGERGGGAGDDAADAEAGADGAGGSSRSVMALSCARVPVPAAYELFNNPAILQL